MSTSELLNPFSALTFHSAGSPAPWQTSPASLPPHLRTLVAAILSLSTALTESSDQLEIVKTHLDRANSNHRQLRQTVFAAQDSVLRTSQQAQNAHAEAKRVDTLEAVFKKGADRAVSSLDRRVLRALRKGKMRAYRREGPEDDVCPVIKREVEEEFAAFNFVEELLIDLDIEAVDLENPDSPSSTLELDDEWLAMEEELIVRLATKARERGSTNYRRTSMWRKGVGSDSVSGGESDGATTDGDDALSDAGSNRISSPSTPPSSVHSFDASGSDSLGDDENRPSRPPTPDYDTLIDLLTPLVHPVLLLLFRLRHLLASRLTSAIDAFETLVKASAEAVRNHRECVAKLNKNAAKIRDLKDLERREVEEEERLLGEFRGVVVELAKVRKLPTRIPEEDETSEYEEDDYVDGEGEEENEDV